MSYIGEKYYLLSSFFSPRALYYYYYSITYISCASDACLMCVYYLSIRNAIFFILYFSSAYFCPLCRYLLFIYTHVYKICSPHSSISTCTRIYSSRFSHLLWRTTYNTRHTHKALAFRDYCMKYTANPIHNIWDVKAEREREKRLNYTLRHHKPLLSMFDRNADDVIFLYWIRPLN